MDIMVSDRHSTNNQGKEVMFQPASEFLPLIDEVCTLLRFALVTYFSFSLAFERTNLCCLDRFTNP